MTDRAMSQESLPFVDVRYYGQHRIQSEQAQYSSMRQERQPSQKQQTQMMCSTHRQNLCTLIGYDRNCDACCMLCLQCLDDPDGKSHKRQHINHKSINLKNLETSIEQLRVKNQYQTRRNRDLIDQYFDRLREQLDNKLNEQKQKLYNLSQLLMLTEITQDKNKLKVLQILFLKKYERLKCSDIAEVAKDLINFKVGGPPSHGYEEFNKFILDQMQNLKNQVNNLSFQPKYCEITLQDSLKAIDYPLFNRPLVIKEVKKEEKRPSPPKVTLKKEPPPKVYIKPFSLVDVKEFRNVGLKKFQFGDSKVLNKEDSHLLTNFLNKVNPKGMELLYRASQNNFSVPRFHQLCDGKANTLVVVRTQFNKIIGGYTPIPWKSTTGTMHSDIHKETFLFSLSLKQKFELQDVKSAIFNYSLYGPCFGAGSDLAIFPQADTEANSYSDFPYSFNNNYHHERNQHTTQNFCGQNKGRTFLIKEWQVWQLKVN